MVQLIDDHREAYGVEPICSVRPIGPSVYYEPKARAADPRRLPKRLAREHELRVEIERVWKENQSVYGARKAWKQMKREGIEVARCTVEQALAARRDLDGLVHHSDRGVQYLSIRYTERLAEEHFEPSVGSAGDAYDNALAETIRSGSAVRCMLSLGVRD